MTEDVSAGRLALQVTVDASGLRADLKAKADAAVAAYKAQVKAEMVLDSQKYRADLKAATKDQSVKVKASADTNQAKADLDDAAKDRESTIKARADTNEARTELDALAKPRTTTIKAKVDKSGLGQLGDIGDKVSSALTPVAMTAGLITAVGAAGQLVGALGAVAAAASEAAGVAAALPGLLLAAGQAAGSIVLGFSGVSKAVSAYQSAQSSAGTSAVQSAKQVQAAQDQVRTSAQALRDAQIDGAQQVASAEHGVSQAAQSLADAQYQAAQQVKGALHDEQQSVIAVSDAQYEATQSTGEALHTQQQDVQALADARYNAAQSGVTSEHSYTDALYSEQQAQLSLTAAREAARQNLIQTSFDLRSATIGEAQASLTLSEAKTKLANVNQSAASTADQKTQAALDLQQAQLAYDQSVNGAQQAATAKQKADKAGVDGSQQVIAATHEEADARFSLTQSEQAITKARQQSTQAVKEAQYEVQQSAKASARAQVEAVRSVQDAEYQEAQSVQAYSRSKVTASESLSSAEYQQAQAVQSLTNARRTSAEQLQNSEIGYKEALEAAKSPTLGVSSAQTALNKAMAGLTPAGRTLVNFIDSTLLPRYKKLQQATASALLPGVTSGLKSAMPILGTVQKGLTGTGKVVGGLASRFGGFLGSAGVNSDLSGIMSTNTKAVGLFGDAALHIVDAIRNVTVVAEPLVTKVSQWADHIAKVADSLSKSGRESGSMASFFDRAWKSATQLYDIGKNLLGTLLHIFGAAAPSGTSLLGSLVTATDKLDKWAGSSGGQAQLKKFFTDTVPVAKQFGDVLVKAAGVLGKLVSGFGGGSMDSLFTVLNLALTILSTLVGLPGFGQVVQWVLLLSGTGAGLGIVASKIAGIGKGLASLTKLTGLDKLTKTLGLGDTVGEALGGGAKKLGGAVVGKKATAAAVADDGTQVEAAAATGIRGAASKAGGWLSAVGQGAASMAGQIAKGVKAAGGYLATLGTNAAGVASKFGSKMAGMGTAALQFVASLGKQLVAGAKSLVIFAAEHTTAAAVFIGENLAMMASATAAFIAENLATLGIVAAIGLIVTAIIYVATHWSQVWGEIKKVGGDAWHWIDGNIVQPIEHAFGHGGVIGGAISWVEAKWNEVWTNLQNWAKDAWNFIYDGIHKYLLVFLGPVGLIVAGILAVSKHWNTIWGDIKSTIKTVAGDISKIVGDLVSGIKKNWDKVSGIFEAPVKFVVNKIYDDGLAKLWNDVAKPLHMPQLPTFKMQAGGRVPGTGPGDKVPILGESGEWMLSKKQVASFFGGGSLERGHAMLASLFGQGSAGPGYSVGGGILGDLGHAASSVGHGIAAGVSAAGSGIVSGVKDALSKAAFLAQVVADPAGAMKKYLAGPLGQLGGLGDSGLGQMIAKVPSSLVGDLIAKVKSAIGLGDSPAGAGGNVKPPIITGTVKDWFTKAVAVTGVPTSWIPGLETIGKYESSENPLAINNSDINAANGDPSRGVMQVIGSTFAAFHQKGTADNIYDPIANIAAAINYIKSRYGSIFSVPGIVSLSRGQGYAPYDTGGALKPGLTSVVNATGRDEWVLTPTAVDLLGGPAAVAHLNQAGTLYKAGSAQVASAVAPARPATGDGPTVIVNPTPGMSESHIGSAAARELGFMLG